MSNPRAAERKLAWAGFFWFFVCLAVCTVAREPPPIAHVCGYCTPVTARPRGA
ncbi:MAG TPA: hypothetical protein VGM29_07485 [Polyangiaceae bacterium]